MRFSPLLVSSLIIEPLRYFFANQPPGRGVKWDPDDKKTEITIDTVNNFHNITWESRPRILVGRGSYIVTKSGLTDNLAQAKGIRELEGASNRINQVWVNGAAQIIIEAEKEGTCELLTDMVSHFIVWSRPLLCDTQGFSEFGLDLQVSECIPDKEAKEKFGCRIAVPYRIEEHWTVRWDTVKYKNMFATIQPGQHLNTNPTLPTLPSNNNSNDGEVPSQIILK